jgi:GntR family transcriptional regulator
VIPVPIEPTPAKYARIANALQERIENGSYPVGAMVPSEAQLVREFGASRSTVVRALEYLRQLGFIEGVQGKGRIVRGRPPTPGTQAPSRVRAALHAPEDPFATLIGAGPAPASARVAATLAIAAGNMVIARQRLMPANDDGRQLISTIYVPADTAKGTAFHRADLLRDGALDHLERHRRLVATNVVERLAARAATSREATLLPVDPKSPLLTSLLIVLDAAGRPLLLIDLAIAPGPQGTEESFELC